MSKTEQIIALILDLLAARGWSIKPFEVEGEWSVIGGDASHEVLLVLQRTPVQTYLAGLVGSQVTQEMVDSVGMVASDEEFANDAVERLHVVLSAKGPGVLIEAGIRSIGTGAEIYCARALRAAGEELELAERRPGLRIAKQ